METYVSKKNLNEEISKLKQKFASLMEDDLLLEECRKEELHGKRQALLFQNKEEFDKIIMSL